MVDIKKLEEAKLIDRARSGDTSAFSALVELHQERAIHAANGLIGNMEDAKDLAQEAFVKAYEKLDDFKSESRFYTWFYRILANGCKDFLRKRKVRRALSFWFSRDEEDGVDPVTLVTDRSKNAGENLLNRELGTVVQDALEKLPFRQKSVFVLRYLEGLDLEEISESLHISVGAVKATLWQAGQKMQGMLKDYRTEGI